MCLASDGGRGSFSPASSLHSPLSPCGRGVGGEGLFALQSPPNHLLDRIPILKDLVVPETQHVKCLPREPLRSRLVVRHLFRVLAAVEFDNQPTLQAHEVHNVRPWAFADGICSPRNDGCGACSKPAAPRPSCSCGVLDRDRACSLCVPLTPAPLPQGEKGGTCVPSPASSDFSGLVHLSGFLG